MTDKSDTGRVALVSGASRGIGGMIAAKLFDAGFNVVGVARNVSDSMLESEGRGFHLVSCDVTDESQVRRLVSSIRKEFGRLDVLINNAGQFSADLLTTATSKKLNQILEQNLIGTHLMTRESTKVMRANGFGRTVSITSIATRIPIAGNGLYAAAKVGVESLMRSYAAEFESSNMTFNTLGISFVENTGMANALSEAARHKYEDRLWYPSPLTDADIFYALQFILGDGARAITGQCIMLGSPN